MARSRARWAVAVVVLLASLACLPLTLVAGSRATSGGYLNDASESSRAERLLERNFSTGSSQYQLALRADQPVSRQGVATAGRQLVADAAASDGVLYAQSWWNTGDPRLLSVDGRSTLVVMRLLGSDSEAEHRARELTARFAGEHSPFHVTATGRQCRLGRAQSNRTRPYRADQPASPGRRAVPGARLGRRRCHPAVRGSRASLVHKPCSTDSPM